MMLSYKFAIFLVLFKTTFGEETCKCTNPVLTSTWGQFIPTTACTGKCNGLQTGQQECNFNIGGVTNTTNCVVERECHIPDTCEGSWSPWSNTGSCTELCEQQQSRYCYKNGTFHRNNFCFGSQGSSEQNRMMYCRHGECRAALTTSRPAITRSRYRFPTTTIPTTPATPATSTSSLSLTRNMISTISFINGSRSINMTSTINEVKMNDEDAAVTQMQVNLESKPEESNTVMLVAILGSVGFVTIAVVILGLGFLVSRRKKLRQKGLSVKHTAAISNTYSQKNDTYEAVGPALPERPPLRKAPAPCNSQQIYEFPEKEKHLYTERISPDTEHYLLPMTNANLTVFHEEEEIYSNIDENKK